VPIVTIELVEDSGSAAPGPGQLQMLCDDLGTLFASKSAGTWVKLRSLSSAGYAENAVSPAALPRPVFVEVIKAEVPAASELADEARAVCRLVADALNRPVENVHVIYAPAARGRIAFGGELLPDE